MKEVIIDGIKYVPKHPIVEYASFWYMHDNHTFSRLEGNSLEELAESGYNHGVNSPCGMICSPRIITQFSGEERQNEKIVGIPVHHPWDKGDQEWRDEVNKWIDALKDNQDIQRLISQGKINK